MNLSTTHGQDLVNPNATEEAIELKNFLDSIYGEKILSGQAFESVSENWLSIISDATGGLQPAILSLDFMNSMPWRVENGTDPDATTEVAIDWSVNKGGIVEMHWHWDAPKDTDFSTWQGFYTENTTFDLKHALSDTTTEEYQLLIRDMDIVADLLLRMQDEGVPVLWRPLHEAEGTWFWWGAHGGEACKELYRILYDRLVNHHGINNLIWVWNSYGTTRENWYPGDDVVDIIAWDYPDYNETSGSWSQYQQLFGDNGKPFAIGEDSKLVDPDLLSTQHWLYFITWAYMIQDPSLDRGRNTADWINTVYNDARVLTLDDLQSGPKAYAGIAQTIYDEDGDGKEEVSLDGSKSYTDEGSITAYSWTENGNELATGEKAVVELDLGIHEIELTVTTSTGESKTSKVIITIKTPSITLNKPHNASTTEADLGNDSDNALDGDESTRWSSTYEDPQWFVIDLEKRYDISSIVINWETASAKSYRVDLSNDSINWFIAAERNDMPGGPRIDSLNAIEGGARYIRFYGMERNTAWGYSFYEFEAFGKENPDAEPGGEPLPGGKVLNTDESQSSLFKVYPTILTHDSMLSIITAGYGAITNVTIYDLQGSIVLSENGDARVAINIPIDNRFHQGLYIVGLETSKKQESRKIIIH